MNYPLFIQGLWDEKSINKFLKMVKNIKFRTISERNSYIVNQRQKNVPVRELADELGITERTIRRICATYRSTRRVGRKVGSGRRKALNSSMKLKIHRMLTNNPSLTCKELALRLGNVVSDETIRLYLKGQDFSWKQRSRVPNISEEDKQRRLDFAESNMEIEFDSIFFTDECTFDLNGTTKVWGKKGKRILKGTSTYAPKVQVWGAISAQGKAYLEIFYGNMDSDLYMDILEDRFEPIALEIMGDSWILQHDGARCHTSRAVTELLEEMEIETLDWPPRSPDLSPIENVWSLLKRQVYKRSPRTLFELENFILEEWDRLDDRVVGRMAQSFQRRLEGVIEAEGSILKY